MPKSLNETDTSYWNTTNKDWKAERKADWPQIESMLSGYKTKKGLNIIKAYFLRGKMPNWDMLRDWAEETRHVDLFVFLWLHPSWDGPVLRELRDIYINSKLITRWDLLSGFEIFLDSQTVVPTTSLNITDIDDWPCIEGHGELLFDVMFGNPVQTKFELPPLSKVGKKQSVEVKCPDFSHLFLMMHWLSLDKLLVPIQHDFLYQFQGPLDWWYESVKDFDFSDLDCPNRHLIPYIPEALSKIHQFDIDKEGDSCRTRFFHTITSLFDERDFDPEFKKIWEAAKKVKP